VTIRNANGTIEDDAWVIDAEISIEPVGKALLLTPTLSFEQEGGQFGVRWARLEIMDGTAEIRPEGLLVPPRTKRVIFKGFSDPRSHPVPATSSAVFVDVAAKPTVASN
jgi:RNA polymerase primary sigma factor